MQDAFKRQSSDEVKVWGNFSTSPNYRYKLFKRNKNLTKDMWALWPLVKLSSEYILYWNWLDNWAFKAYIILCAFRRENQLRIQNYDEELLGSRPIKGRFRISLCGKWHYHSLMEIVIVDSWLRYFWNSF